MRNIVTSLALARLRGIADRMTRSGESSLATLAAYPGVQRIPTSAIDIVQCRGFLSPAIARALIAMIDAERRPSTIADDNGDAAFRTSETCDLAPEHPAVGAIAAQLDALTGIDPAHGEPLQGQRYAVGQEFKPHTDYFAPNGVDYDRFCAVAGQRTWTAMVYLNDVDAGGGTRFKALGKTFQPETGKLLCWNNRRADGSVNPSTLHHGMKVRRGIKYVITKWYRERPWG